MSCATTLALNKIQRVPTLPEPSYPIIHHVFHVLYQLLVPGAKIPTIFTVLYCESKQKSQGTKCQ